MYIESWYKTDINSPVRVIELPGNLFTADSQGNLIGVEVVSRGRPVELSGGVTGYVIRGDDATVIVNGSVSANKASVVLPEPSYAVAGPIQIVIKVSRTTVGAFSGYVRRSTSDAIVDPGHIIPDINELLAKIADCEAATASANNAAINANSKATLANNAASTATAAASNASSKAESANTAASNANAKATAADTAANAANTAATNANNKATLADQKATAANTAANAANTAATNADNKATLANTAANNANSKASLADTAATNAAEKATAANNAAVAANTAAAKINNMTVAAQKLSEGTNPTAAVSEVDGHKHILFGIPKGDRGKDFHISHTFISIAAMEEYSGEVDIYDYAMIDTGSVEDVETGRLYCYEDDEQWHYIGDLSGKQGIKGETGTGIDHIVLNQNYTLTIFLDDGTAHTTASIRGATGITPAISIGTVTTLTPNQSAYVQLDQSSTPEAPVFNFGIPKGATGSLENVFGTSVPMSESDSTSVFAAINNKLAANQGSANAGKFMKVGDTGELIPDNVPDPSGKADKVANATPGNFAGLDANGNLTDSGKKASDFVQATNFLATEMPMGSSDSTKVSEAIAVNTQSIRALTTATQLTNNVDYTFSYDSGIGQIAALNVWRYCGMYFVIITGYTNVECQADSSITIINSSTIEGHTNFIGFGTAELQTGNNAAAFRYLTSTQHMEIKNSLGPTVATNTVFRFYALLIPTN